MIRQQVHHWGRPHSITTLKISIIVPIRNKADVAPACLDSLQAAARYYPNSRVIVVDNGSTDGTWDLIQRFKSDFTVLSSDASRVGAVRNAGARHAPEAEVYAFIDGDCLVPVNFLQEVAEVFSISNAEAVGCEVLSPADGHWTERVWDRLHRPGGDGLRHYINSACFCIRSNWFWELAGFDEQKISSEDVDICRRLRAGGGKMWQSERLAILHLGNPKTVAGFYRRLRWHGEGSWEVGKRIQWSATTVATLLHPLAAIGGSLVAVKEVSSHSALSLFYFLVGVLITPASFVVARAVQHRRMVPLFGGIALMLITLPARFHGILRSMNRRRI